MIRPALFSFCVLASAAVAGPKLELLSSVDGGKPTAEWKYVRLGQTVRLFAAHAPKDAQLRWYRLEPTDTAVDNTQPNFHFEALGYRAVEIEACTGKAECAGDAALQPLQSSPVAGTGTFAFQLTATLVNGDVISTPGVEARVLGGLSKQVHRIAVRRDDSYLGYLTELFQTPYIFGSTGDRHDNQVDLLQGSDCADLAVYGLRREGRAITYASSWTIDQQVPLLLKAENADSNGIAIDAKGAQIRIGPDGVQPGDLLHFPGRRHIAVLYEDRPPVGVLDTNDLMIHTCWARPAIEAIGGTDCASFPIRILRPRATPKS